MSYLVITGKGKTARVVTNDQTLSTAKEIAQSYANKHPRTDVAVVRVKRYKVLRAKK